MNAVKFIFSLDPEPTFDRRRVRVADHSVHKSCALIQTRLKLGELV